MSTAHLRQIRNIQLVRLDLLPLVAEYLPLLQIGQVGLRDNAIPNAFSNLMYRLLMTTNPTMKMMTDLSQPLASHAVGGASMICSPQLLYNLGKTAFVGEARDSLTLNTRSATHWLSFTSTKEVRKWWPRWPSKFQGVGWGEDGDIMSGGCVKLLWSQFVPGIAHCAGEKIFC